MGVLPEFNCVPRFDLLHDLENLQVEWEVVYRNTGSEVMKRIGEDRVSDE